MITGAYPSGLDHNVVPGSAVRLYLLPFRHGALAIEVGDIHDTGKLAEYSDIVRHLALGSQ